MRWLLGMLLLAAPAAAQKAVMEGVNATRYTIRVDTTNGRVEIGTSSYTGGIPNTGLFIASNVVVGTLANKNACVIYATGTVTCLGQTLGVGGGGWTTAAGIVKLATITDYVGIGTASPALRLDIQDGNLSTTVPDDLLSLGFNANYGLRIGQIQQDGSHVGYYFKGMNGGVLGSTVAFIDTLNGRVGLYTSIPLSAFDVNGNVTLSGATGSGKTLEFRDSGNAKYNFIMAENYNINNGLEFTPSTAAGGTTYNNPSISIAGATGNVAIKGSGATTALSVYGGPVTSYTAVPSSITCNVGAVSFLADSNDQSGSFTSASGTWCDITFSAAYPKKPHCFCNIDSTGGSIGAVNLATTGFRCTAGLGLGGYTVSYFCWGAP